MHYTCPHVQGACTTESPCVELRTIFGIAWMEQPFLQTRIRDGTVEGFVLLSSFSISVQWDSPLEIGHTSLHAAMLFAHTNESNFVLRENRLIYALPLSVSMKTPVPPVKRTGSSKDTCVFAISRFVALGRSPLLFVAIR